MKKNVSYKLLDGFIYDNKFSSDFELVNFVSRSSIHVIILLGVTEIKYTTEIVCTTEKYVIKLEFKVAIRFVI